MIIKVEILLDTDSMDYQSDIIFNSDSSSDSTSIPDTTELFELINALNDKNVS